MEKINYPNKSNEEMFEEYKQNVIKALNELKAEDDPHVLVIFSEQHHDDPTYISCSCGKWVAKVGFELMTRVAPAVLRAQQTACDVQGPVVVKHFREDKFGRDC